MSEKRAIGGAVAFEDSKMLFIANVVTNKEQSINSNAQSASFGIKNRWAYVAVGYAETKALRENSSSNQDLLEGIQKKYKDILKDAVTKQTVTKLEQVRDLRIPYGDKYLYLEGSAVCSTNSIKEVLQVNAMPTQASNLKEVHTKQGPRTTRMTLAFSRHQAQELIKNDHCFAIVALAYSYKGKASALSTVFAPEVQVALIPRTRLECGVFFDGTFNNMYNTEMRKGYEEYFEDKLRMITGQDETTSRTWEDDILDLKVPKSDLMPLIFEDLQKKMEDIYGTTRKIENEYDDGVVFGWFQDDVSKDCDAIYNYFRDSEIQKLLKEIQKIENNKKLTSIQKDMQIKSLKKEAYEGKSSYLGKDKHIDNYVEEKILIGDSYTGALSNVAKLHKLYDTSVNASTHKEQHLFECFREKLYVTGAGTHSDNKEGDHEEDDLFLGQALAIGDAGVKAKVNDACKKLHSAVLKTRCSYIDTLVLDVFGFSRGAAEARHFVGLLCKDLNCSFERKLVVKPKQDADEKSQEFIEYELTKNGDNLYPHILREKESEKDKIVIDKIVFRFVGVFDTVPHLGLFQGNEKNSLELKLEPKKVTSVVHLTAKNEFRYNFDLVSIFSKGDYSEGENRSGNFIEKEFFGAHSDVGGGYRDNKSETVELPTVYKSSVNDTFDEEVKRKVISWNNKKFWVNNPCSIIINDKDEIGTRGDGFYIKKYIYRKGPKKQIRVSRYHVYMYRQHIDTEYDQIPYEFMHSKAGELVSIKEITGLTYKDIQLDKGKLLSLDTDYYNSVKSKVTHHSISLGVANKPNRDDSKKEFYGKRDVHYV